MTGHGSCPPIDHHMTNPEFSFLLRVTGDHRKQRTISQPECHDNTIPSESSAATHNVTAPFL